MADPGKQRIEEAKQLNEHYKQLTDQLDKMAGKSIPRMSPKGAAEFIASQKEALTNQEILNKLTEVQAKKLEEINERAIRSRNLSKESEQLHSSISKFLTEQQKIIEKKASFYDKIKNSSKEDLKSQAEALKMQIQRLEAAKAMPSIDKAVVEEKIKQATQERQNIQEVQKAQAGGLSSTQGVKQLGRNISNAISEGMKESTGNMFKKAFGGTSGKDWVMTLVQVLVQGLLKEVKAGLTTYETYANLALQRGQATSEGIADSAAIARTRFTKYIKEIGNDIQMTVDEVGLFTKALISLPIEKLTDPDATQEQIQNIKDNIVAAAGLGRAYGLTAEEINKINIRTKDIGMGPLDQMGAKLSNVLSIGEKVAQMDIGLSAKEGAKKFLDLAVDMRSLRMSASDTEKIFNAVAKGMQTMTLQSLGFTVEDMNKIATTAGKSIQETSFGMQAWMAQMHGVGKEMQLGITESYFASMYGREVGKRMKGGEDIFMQAEKGLKFGGVDVSAEWDARFKTLDSILEPMRKEGRGAGEISKAGLEFMKQFGITDEKTALSIISMRKDLVSGNVSAKEKLQEIVDPTKAAADRAKQTAMATATMEQHLNVIKEQLLYLAGGVANMILQSLSMIVLTIMGIATFLKGAFVMLGETFTRLPLEIRAALPGGGEAKKKLEELGPGTSWDQLVGPFQVMGVVGKDMADSARNIAEGAAGLTKTFEPMMKKAGIEDIGSFSMVGTAASAFMSKEGYEAAQLQNEFITRRRTGGRTGEMGELFRLRGDENVAKLSTAEINKLNSAFKSALQENNKKQKEEMIKTFNSLLEGALVD